MINKDLNLNQCLDLLNQLLENIEDYDCDSDGVIYIAVDYESSTKILNKLIDNLEDYISYMKDFKEDDYVDIVGLWCEVMDRFSTNIWVDFKKKKFYVCKWYHRLDHNINQWIKRIKDKIKDIKSSYKMRRFYKKEEKKTKKRIKEFCK